MKLLVVIIIATCFAALEAGECNSYECEKLNEGYHTCVYRDPVGIRTIGVGFNLQKFGAREEIEVVGADYNRVLNGSECLSDSQIERLFDKDMASAVGCAAGWLSNWSSLGSGPQSAIADMAFNLGCAGLREFVSLKSALEDKDYSRAAQDMKDSLWCGQVGDRCDRDVTCMK